jgi:hypothetical protein
MGTATRSEAKTTTTVKRSYLLHLQVRNLLARTTDISQTWLSRIDTALTNRWIRQIGVYGLDDNSRCHVGLELTINWATHRVQLLLVGDKVPIARAVFSPDDLAPEVHNGIAVFNQAVNAECLRTERRVTYARSAPVERIRRGLGFVPAAPLTWAGNVEQQTYSVPELPELTVTFLQAIPDDTGTEQGLLDLIKAAFG